MKREACGNRESSRRRYTSSVSGPGICRCVASFQQMEGLVYEIGRECGNRYTAANRDYRRLLMRAPIGQAADPGSPLARARSEETEALAEYLRVLRDSAQYMPEGKLLDSGEAVSNLIAIIDDDESIRDSIKALLRSAGYQRKYIRVGRAIPGVRFGNGDRVRHTRRSHAWNRRTRTASPA